MLRTDDDTNAGVFYWSLIAVAVWLLAAAAIYLAATSSGCGG